MNSPYMGKFKVSQRYTHGVHDGLDLVGIDSKEIHSTINGKVVYAGWENDKKHSQGFGQYVKILKDGTNDYYYFGHLSSLNVSVGQTVKTTQVIGVEGSTGFSTGSHCHYCMRTGGKKGNDKDISAISGIPNVDGKIYDDGYKASKKPAKIENTVHIEQVSNNRWINLPSGAVTWSVYKTNVQPIKKNACGQVRPSKFGGLSYVIIGNPMADVYTIRTDSFGVVNIYGATSTGATITNNRTYQNGN